MTKVRRILVMLVAALTLIGGGIATAGAASAATPLCNTRNPQEGNISVPYYSAGAASTTSCYLWSGHSAGGVRYLQEALVYCYGQTVSAGKPGVAGIDGIFGATTKQALINVQRSLGLTADGKFGPATHNAMRFHGWANGSGASLCLTALFKA